MADVLALISKTMMASLKDIQIYTTDMEHISQLYDLRALYRASNTCATDLILSQEYYDTEACYKSSLDEKRAVGDGWAMVSMKAYLIKELARAHIFSTHPHEIAYLLQQLSNQKKQGSYLVLEMPMESYRSLADRVPSQFIGLKMQHDGHATRLLKSNILERKNGSSMLLDPTTPEVSIDKVVEGIREIL